MRRSGQDVDTELRVDRSVAAGLKRTALQDDSTLLIPPWTAGQSVRSYLLRASYSEIVAATSVPALIAAPHSPVDLENGNVALLAHDVSPGGRPSPQLAADVARSLAGHDRPLIVGPTSGERLARLELDLPEHTRYTTGDDVVEWVEANTRVGDIVVVPFVGITIRAVAHKIHDRGRSILAVAYNPASRPTRGASAMSIATGGTIDPT